MVAGSYRCLVVEDSAPMRQLIVYALERMGVFEITEATDGLAALKSLTTTQFDVVITDINMPLVDGLKLIGRVRADERHREVPIVVVTTESGSEDRDRALSLGATAYVSKPVRGAELEDVMRRVLKIS